MDTAFSCDYFWFVLGKKLFVPLSPIRRNYPKINVNNGPEFKCGILKKALVTKLCCSLHQLCYSIKYGMFIEFCSVRMCRYRNSNMILCICRSEITRIIIIIIISAFRFPLIVLMAHETFVVFKICDK